MTDWRLAHYEITAHLGSGGMGDVYEATDTKLGRRVALKLLPEAFVHDAERVTRFEREAKTLAALNHPHIATLHDLEESNGQRFLVMELVPGETLAERIGGSPLQFEDAVAFARQIIDALEAAHDQGIVHRDLKPANVKVTPDGRVKVLDFGLAKLDEPTGASAPTMIAGATEAGVILGTVGYMAPEQAKGSSVDRRADIFAFGCILYEMLTGRAPFEGESAADTLSRVLQRDPDWTRLTKHVPESLRRLLRLCLAKDPKQRRQAAGDVRIDLELALAEAASAPPPGSARGTRWLRAAAVAGAMGLIALLAVPASLHLRETPPPEMRLELVTPPTRSPFDFALSPDGRSIVFAAESANGDAQQLFLRAFDEAEARPIPGTSGARSPFWAADGKSVGFFASGQLFRVDLSGGPAQSLAPVQTAMGGAWNTDGTILFARNTVSPLYAIAAGGGDAAAATTIDSPRQIGHGAPSFLPDGRRFLFYARGDADVSGLYLSSLDGNAPKRLAAADGPAIFVAPDRVAFLQQGSLVVRRLDAERAELVGDSTTVAAGVGAFSVSSSGMLAYRAAAGGEQARLTWIDRRGGTAVAASEVLNGPELSPDARHLAVDRTVQGNRDVWLMDLARGSLTPFTSHPAVDGYPVWSPDGADIAFESTRNGTFDLWVRPSNGASPEQLLLETPDAEWPLHWSSDGAFLLFQQTDLRTKWDLLALPLRGGDRTPVTVASSSFAERMGQFSPDGRWVAYETNESGRPEVVVQSFPNAGGKFFVSIDGGTAPRWSTDGTELFFVAPDGTIMAAAVVASDSTFETAKPEPLLRTAVREQTFKHQYAVSRDGRFLVNDVTPDQASVAPITLVLNWKP